VVLAIAVGERDVSGRIHSGRGTRVVHRGWSVVSGEGDIVSIPTSN
jgi:hypothetical protein